MHPDRPELASLGSTLSDVVERVAAAATRAHEASHETLATELWEVERSLRAAQRRLSKAIDSLSD